MGGAGNLNNSAIAPAMNSVEMQNQMSIIHQSPTLSPTNGQFYQNPNASIQNQQYKNMQLPQNAAQQQQ
jgi:hypothetical protein